MWTELPNRFQNLWQLPAGVRTALANSDYRLLLSSSTLWWLAHFVEMIVLGWLVLELTNSPGLVGLVGFCRAIPVLFVEDLAARWRIASAAARSLSPPRP